MLRSMSYINITSLFKATLLHYAIILKVNDYKYTQVSAKIQFFIRALCVLIANHLLTSYNRDALCTAASPKEKAIGIKCDHVWVLTHTGETQNKINTPVDVLKTA